MVFGGKQVSVRLSGQMHPIALDLAGFLDMLYLSLGQNVPTDGLLPRICHKLLSSQALCHLRQQVERSGGAAGTGTPENRVLCWAAP